MSAENHCYAKHLELLTNTYCKLFGVQAFLFVCSVLNTCSRHCPVASAQNSPFQNAGKVHRHVFHPHYREGATLSFQHSGTSLFGAFRESTTGKEN